MRIDSVGATESRMPVSDQDKKLKQACKDFEAIFTGFMLKSMRKTITKTDLFGSSKEEEMFQDMMDDEISKRASETNPMGIADMLYKQLRGENR
ncbi:MAG: rod-binding protein [Armatimonadetes bacterium]|nr:rod-binding protein [Armatimonadota bacterium]